LFITPVTLFVTVVQITLHNLQCSYS